MPNLFVPGIMIVNLVLALGLFGSIIAILVLIIKLLVKKNKLADIELQKHYMDS